MCKDVLGVFESLGHLSIVTLQCMVQREGLSLSLLVHIGDQSALRIKEDLSVILEIHLDDLVAEPKHDGVFSSHPFLYVNRRILAAWLRIVCR